MNTTCDVVATHELIDQFLIAGVRPFDDDVVDRAWQTRVANQARNARVSHVRRAGRAIMPLGRGADRS